ncbi:hypothetical protein GCM10023144_03870 [Pigmentiphaga soli]|uniref:HTH lysR-type domain-containing protein n=1 Tax=Pigmentiphaga soli TaxID=1007095 RepID=A0ABP8GF20_9BURK
MNPKVRLPPLNALRAFEAAARHENLTRAADELNVTQAAVSHQVKLLEESLGVPLFRRLSGGLKLTEQGKRYAMAVNNAMQILLQATENVLGSGDKQSLRISAQPNFASRWLVPRLWGLVITHGCLTYSIYLFLTWLPSYLMDVRGLTIMSAGFVGTLPYIISSVGTIVIGLLSDRYLSNKDVSRGGRKWLVILMLALSSCVFLVPVVQSTFLLVAIISASILFATAANTMNLALTGDLIVDKDSAGAAYGLLILGGNTFGFLAPLITGYVIQVTHSYTWSFIIAGLFMVAGIVSLSLVKRPLQPAEA